MKHVFSVVSIFSNLPTFPVFGSSLDFESQEP